MKMQQTNSDGHAMVTRGLLLVVSGPSGCGKGTVCDKLRNLLPDLMYSISATTRKPRPKEVDGNDYLFLTREQFEERVKTGGFLEWAEVYGNLYGTPRSWVETTLAAGHDVLLEIDTQGALKVKANYPDAVLVFLWPPTPAELQRRISGRATESKEQMRRRLSAAGREMVQVPHYDYLVLNDTVERAVGDLVAVLTAERCRVNRIDQQRLDEELEGYIL